MSDLNGKVAVVTGGSGGIGSAICQRLAAAGASVVLTYNRDAAGAQRVAESLAGAEHLVVQTRVDDSAWRIATARWICWSTTLG